MSGIKETVKATGKVSFKLYDANGNIKDERQIDNMVVTTGLQYITARMRDIDIPAQMSHMALGEGAIAPVLTDDSLGDEVERHPLSGASIGGTGTKITYTTTFPSGTAGAITEAGIFNDDTAGDMLCRTTFAVINKEIADTLAVTWEITIS